MPAERETKDEPVDALYRACKRYEELHARNSPGLDRAFSTIVMYYVQRIRGGDYLSPPPIEMTSDGYFNMTGDTQVLDWIGQLMNEIERRRNARGRNGTGASSTVL